MHKITKADILGLNGTLCQAMGAENDNEMMGWYLTAPTEEMNDYIARVKTGEIPNDAVYLKSGIRHRGAYRDYLKSERWKQKRDFVLKRSEMRAAAAGKLKPKGGIKIQIVRSDGYNAIVRSIEMDWKPTCEKGDCTNEATQVHHLTYERIGAEMLADLQALCGECHRATHR